MDVDRSACTTTRRDAPPGSHVRARRLVPALAGTAALLIAAAPAFGHPAKTTLSKPIAEGLAGPLQLAVDGHGGIYVAQDFAGLLTRIDRHGSRNVAANPGGEVAGVAIGPRGAVYYSTTNADPTTQQTTAAALSKLGKGSSKLVADTLAYESANNPDQHQSYGFESIPADCAAQWPVDQFGPPQYTGIVDSHPYAVAAAHGVRYIADAAANAILSVGESGHIHTVAVLPPQPTLVTSDLVAALGLPACVTGLTYDFEAVPTDVEIGRDGKLYVTTLPGGPEDPSAGARGAVYRINVRSHRAKRIASGLAGAVNLALGKHGTIYVSELFANRVSKIVHGAPRTLLELTSPAALEYARGKLYVGYDVFASGKVATISVGHAWHGHHASARRTAAATAREARLVRSLSPWSRRTARG